VKRRTFLGGLLAGFTVGIASQYIPLRERKKAIKEAQPSAKGYFDLRDNNWHHCMVFFDRSGPAQYFMDGKPYNTKRQKVMFWLRKKLQGIEVSPEPKFKMELGVTKPGFTTGGYFKAPDNDGHGHVAKDVVVEMVMKRSEQSPVGWSAGFKRLTDRWKTG